MEFRKERKEIVAERIKNLRDLHHLSINDLARVTGIGASTITQIENARYPISGDILVILAEFFNVTTDYILGLVDVDEKHYKKDLEILYTESYESYLRYTKRGDLVHRQADNETPLASWPYNLFEYCKLDIDAPLSELQMEGLTYVLDNLLTTREAACLLAYFMKEQSLDEVSKSFNVTRERIRQVIQKACRKLKHPSRVNIIKYGIHASEYTKEAQLLEAKLIRLEELRKEVEGYDELIEEIKAKKEKLSVNDPRFLSLETLDLSVRAFNCMKRIGCETVNDIIPLFKSNDIYKVRNLGRKCYLELYDKLKSIGISEEELTYDPTFEIDDFYVVRENSWGGFTVAKKGA